MLVDYSPRMSGKTTKLIKWLQEDPNTRYLITFSPQEENRLRQLFPELKRCIHFWGNWVKKKRNGELKGLHSRVSVDNADYVLEKMLQSYIDKISVTREVIDLR